MWEEIDEEFKDEIAFSHDYVRLPDQYEIQEYRIMQKFTDSLNNVYCQEKLYRALNGRKPYRHFKDEINYLGISELYYKWRSEAYYNIARKWCEKHEIAYQE